MALGGKQNSGERSVLFWRVSFAALSVARSQQVYMEWLEATVLLSIYLRSKLILIDTKVPSARCPLADVPGSACEMPPPCHLATWDLPS